MKQKTLILLAIVAITAAFFSCKKEYDVKPSNETDEIVANLKVVNALGDTLIRNIVTNFDGTSSQGPIQSAVFDFGDGTVDTFNVSSNDEIYHSHKYTAKGQYWVNLNVYSGPDATGTLSTDGKTVWVVDTLSQPPPPSPSGLIFVDSVAGNSVRFAINVDSTFYPGVQMPFHYKGDNNSWGLTLKDGVLLDSYFYFWVDAIDLIHAHRFTLIKLNGSTEMWATFQPHANRNEFVHELISYNCVEFYLENGVVYGVFTPGTTGDQQVSLEAYGTLQTKINVKHSNWYIPGATPGISFQLSDGTWTVPVPMEEHPDDPNGRWSYYIINNDDYEPEGVCHFKTYADYTDLSSEHVWPQSYYYYQGHYAFQTSLVD